MKNSQRIFINIIATYGRSLYTLIIGLFCGRWALMALGRTDYGLFGLIGGLTSFVSFVNGLFAASVGRFYAVSVGETNKDGNYEKGLIECQKWFNTALSIHIVVPLILLFIGYPTGIWAIRNFLTIPIERIDSCVWVWRFTCFSCLVSMFNVPFNAMYKAKQDIAELTIYSFFTATLNVIVLYYMICHPGEWLTKYALWSCILSIIPAIIQAVRAIYKYPELRINCEYLWNYKKIINISVFAFARFWTSLSNIFSNQCNAILVNKFLGPDFNASMSIGNTVASQTTTLSGALSGAFWPAIANKFGEGDKEGVNYYAFLTCKLGTLLVLVFSVPLLIEVEEVMILWLKNPPEYVSIICIAIIISNIIGSTTEGYWMVIMAEGTYMTQYSWIIGWTGFIFFILAWTLLLLGYGIWGVCIAMILSKLLSMLIRLRLGQKMAGLNINIWIKKVAIPVIIVGLASFASAIPIRFLFEASFLRIVLTSIITFIVYLAICYFFALSSEEKRFIILKIDKIWDRIK